ncbi:probable MMS19 nucleotide excision repair protein homolog [Coccomyxa sp. Obi]|nr:probable MMS19 nucleotide excision repair protein homolog [Coccomyxa sp. Obi]
MCLQVPPMQHDPVELCCLLRPSLRPALKGCLALLQQRAAPVPKCTASDAEAIMRALLDVNIRSLTVGDRQLSLQLFISLIQGYGSDLVRSPLGLLEGAAAALDGERDPRCLLAGFSIIQLLAGLHTESGEAPAKDLEQHAEELVDVLGCYFPIVYTPPADTTGKVTRGELVAGVESALSAAPAFAPYVVPMLLEKLSSSLRQSQEDALSALAACTKGYGAATMAQHLPKIWDALRTILTAPGDSDLAMEDRIKAEELAGRAQTCLKECVRALGAGGDMQLVDLVLGDGIIRDLLDDVADAGQRGGFAGASGRAQAAAPVLAAVTGSSPLGSIRVCQRLLGSLVRLTWAAQNSESQQLGLRAVLCLVSATREAIIDTMPGQRGGESSHASAGGLHQYGCAGVSASSQPGTSGPSQPGSVEGNRWERESLLAGRGADVLQLASGNAAAQQQAQHAAVFSEGDPSAVGSAGGPMGSDKESGSGPQVHGTIHRESLMLQLQVLAQLATFPKTCSPLSKSEQQKVLTKLIDSACTAPPSQTSFPESPGQVTPPNPKQAAISYSGDQAAVSDVVCSALESMARLGYEDLVSSFALPQLFAAAGLPAPNLAHPGAAPDVEHSGVQNAAPIEARAGERVSSSAAPGAEEMTKELGMHSGSGSISGAVSQPDSSGRPVVVQMALRALASIARASSQLRAPILAACIAGVPGALLAAAAGDESSHSALLETLSDAGLLAGDADAAESLVLELLRAVTDLSKAHRSTSGPALADAATLAQVATSVCSVSGGAHISWRACRIVMSGASSLPTRPHAQVAQETAPAAAAIAALPMDFAPEEVTLQVIRALLDLALGLHDEFTASVAAAAAASIINKAAHDKVDEALGTVLDDILLPRLAQGSTACKRTLSSLGQLSRALVMRGHPRFQDILGAALKLVDSLACAQPTPMDASPGPEPATTDPSACAATAPATVADAAQVFASVVEFDESAALNAPRRIFAKGRVLWQQRAFSVAADLLLQKFEAARQKGDAAPSKGIIACLERLLTAAKKDAPAAVTAGYERVLPAVLTSLAALDGSADASNEVIAAALLEQLQQALATPQGQAVLEGELDRLVPLCAQRAVAAASASHRALAVATLDAVAAYPYHLLHPFRTQVMAALLKAVDDRKRAVRAAAVRCRRKWGAQQM